MFMYLLRPSRIRIIKGLTLKAPLTTIVAFAASAVRSVIYTVRCSEILKTIAAMNFELFGSYFEKESARWVYSVLKGLSFYSDFH